MPEFERLVPRGDDPVQNMLSAFTARGITDWLVNHHHLPEASRKTVESNLQEQFRWHRLQGRLDRGGWLNFFATLMGLKQSPVELKTPENFWGLSAKEPIDQQVTDLVLGLDTGENVEDVRRALLGLGLHNQTVEMVITKLAKQEPKNA